MFGVVDLIGEIDTEAREELAALNPGQPPTVTSAQSVEERTRKKAE